MFTYYVYMNVTLAIDDEVMLRARQRAESLGTSVNQLVREYLAGLAGRANQRALAAEFVTLSYENPGDSRGWKFDRDEIHER